MRYLSKIKRNIILPELKKKIPPHLIDFYLYRYFYFLFSFGFTIFGLAYTDVSGRNGFRYLLLPLIIPWISVIYFLIFPQNPYRGTTLVYPNNLNGLDKVDDDAKRLVGIYRSNMARKFLVLYTFKISGLLFAIMIVFTVIQWPTLNWEFSLNASGITFAICVSFIGNFLLIGGKYVEWGFTTWLESYHQREGSVVINGKAGIKRP